MPMDVPKSSIIAPWTRIVQNKFFIFFGYLLFSRIRNGNSEWEQDRLLPRFSTEYESMPRGCCDPTLIGAQCAPMTASGTGVRILPFL
jgi:hypothetical protein